MDDSLPELLHQTRIIDLEDQKIRCAIQLEALKTKATLTSIAAEQWNHISNILLEVQDTVIELRNNQSKRRAARLGGLADYLELDDDRDKLDGEFKRMEGAEEDIDMLRQALEERGEAYEMEGRCEKKGKKAGKASF